MDTPETTARLSSYGADRLFELIEFLPDDSHEVRFFCDEAAAEAAFKATEHRAKLIPVAYRMTAQVKAQAARAEAHYVTFRAVGAARSKAARKKKE